MRVRVGVGGAHRWVSRSGGRPTDELTRGRLCVAPIRRERDPAVLRVESCQAGRGESPGLLAPAHVQLQSPVFPWVLMQLCVVSVG